MHMHPTRARDWRRSSGEVIRPAPPGSRLSATPVVGKRAARAGGARSWSFCR